jgi:CRP-like cAMP-binding protein
MASIDELKAMRIFSDLEDQYFDKLLPICTTKVLSKGEYLEKEGEESKYFAVVKSGKIAFESEMFSEKTARYVTASTNDHFGESSMIEPYKTTTSRVAIEDSVVYLFNGKKLRELCDNDHSLGYMIINKINKKLFNDLRNSRQQLIQCHWG